MGRMKEKDVSIALDKENSAINVQMGLSAPLMNLLFEHQYPNPALLCLVGVILSNIAEDEGAPGQIRYASRICTGIMTAAIDGTIADLSLDWGDKDEEK